MDEITWTIQNRFTYHKPFGTQPVRYEGIRNKAKELAAYLDYACPNSPEKEYALHYLDLVVMEANASIARNEIEGKH